MPISQNTYSKMGHFYKYLTYFALSLLGPSQPTMVGPATSIDHRQKLAADCVDDING